MAPLSALSFEKPMSFEEMKLESQKHLTGLLSQITYVRSYAKFKRSQSRRECWVETVRRYMKFMKENVQDKLTTEEYNELYHGILNLEVFPSMRLLQFSGKAARTNNMCAYNCGFLSVSAYGGTEPSNDITTEMFVPFSDTMFLSMSGVGVGWSVESHNTKTFPAVQYQKKMNVVPNFVIPDTTEGWCDSLKVGMCAWYKGEDVTFSYDLIRAQGMRLKTKGGFSSGPGPLRTLHEFVKNTILGNQGKQLQSIHHHDIMCEIAERVLSGGNRRAAMISLSDLEDDLIATCKSGSEWFKYNARRQKANNSAVYYVIPVDSEIEKEFDIIIGSNSGERGIFNLSNISELIPERRKQLWIKLGILDAETGKILLKRIGGNPCLEIILLAFQLCNLTEVIARFNDTAESLARKIRLATILGTYQATLTNFHYVSPQWKQNCELERLLGVSITGQKDCPTLIGNAELYTHLRNVSTQVNVEYADRFNINQASAIACVKPSGTAALVAQCSSGIKPPFEKFFIRTVRVATTDPLCDAVESSGVIPIEPEQYQIDEIDLAVRENNPNGRKSVDTKVMSFYMNSPLLDPDHPMAEKFNNRFNPTAIEQLDDWLLVRNSYCDHNPSTTITVDDCEWSAVKEWVKANFKYILGICFFPKFNSTYQQLPYQPITQEQYEKFAPKKVLFDIYEHLKFETYETTQSNPRDVWACAGDSCERLDFTDTADTKTIQQSSPLVVSLPEVGHLGNNTTNATSIVNESRMLNNFCTYEQYEFALESTVKVRV
jgi:ribonucleoside-triphosphate reductase (thioredoxin)